MGHFTGMGWGWGKGRMSLLDLWVVERGVNGQVLDPSRSLGMTGGWGVGGETFTLYCSYAGTPRSYFDGLSTSGPALGDGFTLWADLPEADVPLSARGLGMTGGWGVGGGGNYVVLLLRGHPPAHTSGASARAAPPLGMASRYGRIFQRRMFHFQRGALGWQGGGG